MVYLPKFEAYTGSDCTGTEGTGRTLTLDNEPVLSVGMIVIVNNTALSFGGAYSVTGDTITFNTFIPNTAVITVYYYVEGGSVFETVEDTEYITPLELFEDLEIDISVPNYPSDTTLEVVDSSGTITSNKKLYLDNSKVIKGSITLYYGSDPDNVTKFDPDLDFEVDYNKSEIVLTALGYAKVGSSNVYAEYKYNAYIKSQTVENLICSTSKFIDNQLRQTFNSPSTVLRESLIGQGPFNRLYRPIKRPVYVKILKLSVACTESDDTLTVNSTEGIGVSDYLTINKEVVMVATVTDSTTLVVVRGSLGTTAVSHSIDDELVNVVVEISNTPLPGKPEFKPLRFRSDWNIDSDTGAIQLLHINAVDRSDMAQTVFPPQRIFNRVRLTYKYGWSSIPKDIKRLTFLIVASELRNTNILKAHTGGLDSFQPMGQSAINDMIQKIKNRYMVLNTEYV